MRCGGDREGVTFDRFSTQYFSALFSHKMDPKAHVTRSLLQLFIFKSTFSVAGYSITTKSIEQLETVLQTSQFSVEMGWSQTTHTHL